MIISTAKKQKTSAGLIPPSCRPPEPTVSAFTGAVPERPDGRIRELTRMCDECDLDKRLAISLEEMRRLREKLERFTMNRAKPVSDTPHDATPVGAESESDVQQATWIHEFRRRMQKNFKRYADKKTRDELIGQLRRDILAKHEDNRPFAYSIHRFDHVFCVRTDLGSAIQAIRTFGPPPGLIDVTAWFTDGSDYAINWESDDFVNPVWPTVML